MALSPTASTPTSEGDNSGDLAVVFVDGMTLSVLASDTFPRVMLIQQN